VIAIAHLLARFGWGGPERAVVALAKVARELRLEQSHTVYALESAASPIALLHARHAGIEVWRQPDVQALRAGLAAADVVLVHFWNHPTLTRFLHSPLPPMRLAIWSAVLGERPPQVITPGLVELSDRFVVANPRSLTLPAVAAARPPARFVLSPIDTARLAGVRRRRHATFNVGYIGTVNFAKMHPDFVAMHAAARIPGLRVLVCGGGDERRLAEQARRLGCAERFEFLGHVEAIRDVLARLDVFGYPLCEDNYAASERSLQEAMWCGVAPVILPYGALAVLLGRGETGVVAADETAYPEALETLYNDRKTLRRLGRNARAHARRAFDPRRHVVALSELLADLLSERKRERAWPSQAATPCEMFIESLGEHGGPFLASRRAVDLACARAADEEVARAPFAVASGEGGVFHYRSRDPGDPFLRLWAGLLLLAQGEPERATAELLAARRLGIEESRVREPLARTGHRL
jgi:glycosyltransferase involved in cell wall biosynthesis